MFFDSTWQGLLLLAVVLIASDSQLFLFGSSMQSSESTSPQEPLAYCAVSRSVLREDRPLRLSSTHAVTHSVPVPLSLPLCPLSLSLSLSVFAALGSLPLPAGRPRQPPRICDMSICRCVDVSISYVDALDPRLPSGTSFPSPLQVQYNPPHRSHPVTIPGTLIQYILYTYTDPTLSGCCDIPVCIVCKGYILLHIQVAILQYVPP
jgi:hypothetical protein